MNQIIFSHGGAQVWFVKCMSFFGEQVVHIFVLGMKFQGDPGFQIPFSTESKRVDSKAMAVGAVRESK